MKEINSNEHTSSSLIYIGFSLGMLHVLTPDHLAALSSLSVGSSFKAFMLGVRWGLGHSTGLLACFCIFIILKGDLDLRYYGRYCDALVGFFMMVIGSYGVLGSLRIYFEKKAKRGGEDSTSSSSSQPSALQHRHEIGIAITSGGVGGGGGIAVSTNCSNSGSPSNTTIMNPNPTNSVVNMPDKEAFVIPLDHEHFHIVEDCTWCPFLDMRDPITQRFVSFAIGLLHGVAGPGGILGVLPAVEMQNWQSSSVYLGSFIIASTVSMGTFAACYGESTKRLGATAESVELGLRIFSSTLAIIVGSTWLILSILGKLDDFFHQ